MTWAIFRLKHLHWASGSVPPDCSSQPVFLLQPKHRLGHPSKYLFLLSKRIIIQENSIQNLLNKILKKTPFWWCSAWDYVLPEPTVTLKMSSRSNNWFVTLILPTGTCTVAEILVPESNHMFLAYLDPKNVFSDTENNLFSGWPSHSFSYNKNTAKLQRGAKQQKMIGTAEIRRASDTTFFLCLLMHGIDPVLPFWPKWRLYPIISVMRLNGSVLQILKAR